MARSCAIPRAACCRAAPIRAAKRTRWGTRRRSGTDITRQVARLLAESSFDTISSSARREAKRGFFNWMAGALGGCNNEAVDAALAAVRDFAGPPQATVLGRGMRTDIMH